MVKWLYNWITQADIRRQLATIHQQNEVILNHLGKINNNEMIELIYQLRQSRKMLETVIKENR